MRDKSTTTGFDYQLLLHVTLQAGWTRGALEDKQLKCAVTC